MVKTSDILYIKKIFLVFFLLITVGGYAQKLKKPKLDFEYACGSVRYNNFTFKFDFSNKAFNRNNEFIVEFSDAKGNFANAVELGRIYNKNSAFFDIEGSLALPDNTYGTGYKIRIRSTKPAMVGPASDAFEAYYNETLPEYLTLNNYEKVSICDSKGVTIEINNAVTGFAYRWYKNGQILEGVTGSSYTVKEPGKYNATINFGKCGDFVQSNFVYANYFDGKSIQIEGENTIELCGKETYTLRASIKNKSYIYKWYKNNELIQGLPDDTFSYNTGDSDQFGVYRVEIQNTSGCVSKSQDVTVKGSGDSGFVVEAVGDLERVLLPGETTDLKVNQNSNTSILRWFKDGKEIPSESAEITVSESGKYFLEVVDNSQRCSVIKKSEEFTVVSVSEISPIIDYFGDYNDCISQEATLKLTGASATYNGKYFALTEEQLSSFSFQWYQNNIALDSQTTNEIFISDYKGNGEYFLKLNKGSVDNNSNGLKVFLGQDSFEIESSSQSNILCPGQTIVLTVRSVDGVTYSWSKGDEALNVDNPTKFEVAESGTYTLNIQTSTCSTTLNIGIKPFGDESIKLTPSETAVLRQGQSTKITAEGGEFYQWYNSSGDLVSSTDVFEATKLGTYKLVATIGECSLEKEIKVIADDGSFVIPNILTPFNGDGINDKWEIPNKFAFQSDVTVLIYDSRGKEVLNTTDYQNNWPEKDMVKGGMLFYFKVIQEGALIKAGTLSVLE